VRYPLPSVKTSFWWCDNVLMTRMYNAQFRARAKGIWPQMTQILAWLGRYSVAVDVTAGRYYSAAHLHE
jgi:hypothetical protein